MGRAGRCENASWPAAEQSVSCHKMPSYDWRCKACDGLNIAANANCGTCGCPASCTPSEALATEDAYRRKNGLPPKPREWRWDARWWKEFIAFAVFIVAYMMLFDHLPPIIAFAWVIVGIGWSYKMVISDWRRFMREGRGVVGDS